MIKKTIRVSILLICIILVGGVPSSHAFINKSGQSYRKVMNDEKTLYLPQEIYRVPTGNNYDDDQSEFSHHRKIESENIAVFWSKEYGQDPSNHPDLSKRFSPEEIIEESERFYSYYRDHVKMVQKGNSLSDRYKLLFFVIGGEEGTAFGGGAADSIGIMWASSLRLQNPPYGAVAHEMAHCFQYLARCDGNWAYSTPIEGSKGSSIFEMTAQYMLWQVYPDWLTFENYHLKSYMGKTHYAFLHETNMYHAAHVLEYWSDRHGANFIGRLWRSAEKGEDPVLTYKRLTQMDQKTFNDDIFEAYRRFITWDLDRVANVASNYANQHYTKLEQIADDWYRIAPNHTPQNYGYNGIRLDGFVSGSDVSLDFEGIVNGIDYRILNIENAGWRYGFVAHKKDGSRIYGDIGRDSNGSIKFMVPADTEYLWLVVSGAPTVHHIHLIDGDEKNDEQWPYKIRVYGALPHKDMF